MLTMPTRHLIGRLTVEIVLPGHEQAPARQQEISAWARSDDLWRSLSRALDELVPADEIVTIPRLEVSVEVSSEPAFQAQLGRALTQAIGQLIRCHDSATLRCSQEHYTQQLAWHFLTTGALPWTAPREQAAAVAVFLDRLPLPENEAFVLRLRPASAATPTLWQRLVYAIGIEKVQRLVLQHGHFSPSQTAALLQAATAAETLSEMTASGFWHSIFLNPDLSVSSPLELEQAMGPQAKLAGPATDFLHPSAASQTTSVSNTEASSLDEPVAEAYFVHNGGLVLLGQFLPELFRLTNLLDGDDFRNDEARHKAIHLLQYLATGETEAYEYDLLLNKLLCHQPPGRPVPRWVPLADADLAQADALLGAAIQHWSVLRNTSAAGLRETFLQRPGKLSAAPDGGWRLHVERKTVDILLDRLPMGWGYSVVRLPWLPYLIYVEW